jgi:toxin FitB
MLLDTNVVSELARKTPHPRVIAFLRDLERPQVSVMLFHELMFGLEKATDEPHTALTLFIDDLRQRFGARAIAVDLSISETSARLRAFEHKRGRVLTLADSIMAATALIHDLPLVTRNVKDYRTLDVKLINPFDD